MLSTVASYIFDQMAFQQFPPVCRHYTLVGVTASGSLIGQILTQKAAPILPSMAKPLLGLFCPSN